MDKDISLVFRFIWGLIKLYFWIIVILIVLAILFSIGSIKYGWLIIIVILIILIIWKNSRDKNKNLKK